METHEFEGVELGVANRPCTLCGLPDRHPIHTKGEFVPAASNVSNSPRLDISAALQIDGWMSEKELLWLAELGFQSRFGVEIGTYKGRSARVLADHLGTSYGFLICVDSFSGDLSGDWASVKREWRKNLKSSCAHLWDMDSLDAVGLFKNLHPSLQSTLDFVFIDGNHDYESVSRDIRAWMGLIRPCGLICGHDIGFGGVSRAVKELVPGYEVVPETSIWMRRV